MQSLPLLLNPPAWAGNGHIQTVLGYLVPSPHPPAAEELVEVALPDGDRLIAHHYSGTSDTVLYFFHGFAGSARSPYMRRAAIMAIQQRHSVYAVNHRGCGEGAGLARRIYHAGSAADLAAVIAFGRKKHPGKKHIAVGFSIGGSALLLLLGRDKGPALPDGAITVSAPIDLADAMHRLRSGGNRFYDYGFSYLCKKYLRQRTSDSLPLFPTTRFINEKHTLPDTGYETEAEYFAACSVSEHIPSIQVPTVMISAQDDPIVCADLYASAKLPEAVHLHLEKSGGHLGFLTRENTPLGTRRWIDYALSYYVEAIAKASD
jgi:predicted alpha/beta-fold hydrolase